MKSLKNLWTLAAFVMVLTGCASMGEPQPAGFKQHFAYAVGVHQSILDATTSSLQAGMLSSADAETVSKGAANARLVLDASWQAYVAGDEAGANAKLATALTALTALQDYLRAHNTH